LRLGIGVKPRRSKREETCAVCGTVFPLTVRQASDGKQTCSRVCTAALRSKLKGGLAEAVCEGCGGTYRVSRYYLRQGRRFCGDACRLAWWATQAQRGEANPNWRGGESLEYYGPSWQAARRRAWERDQERCTRCGRTRAEEGQRPAVHHRIAFASFGPARHEEANQLDNLICLCRSCHAKIEGQLFRKG
jgi:hypothetical protein